MRPLLVIAMLVGLMSCGSAPPPMAEKPKLPDLPKPIAEDVRFPSLNRKSITVVDTQLLGVPYLGGGNLAEYDTGKLKYKLLLIRCRTATQAGLYIFDIKNQMREPKFVASYGGYYEPASQLFVFAKGSYIGGISGLSEEDSIQTGKEFAARIPY
ncbi:MAG: hypothetical protein FJW36_13805 [Acidobacteria bacterium]|nr:hypothetical protein [Acidobacteriota bacterium]